MAKKKNGNSKKTTDIKASVSSLIALGKAELFNAPMEDLSPQQKAEAWAVIDTFVTILSQRNGELREGLFEMVQKVGDKMEGGHFQANIEGNEVKRERRQGKLPEDKAFRALLKELSIPLTDCYSEETLYKIDPSKINYLIDNGRLPAEKVEELKKVTYALKVKPRADLAVELDRVSGRFKKLKKAKRTR